MTKADLDRGRLKMKFRTIFTLAAGLAVMALPANATVMTFNDRTSFETAVAGNTTVEEGFTMEVAGADTLVFAGGLVTSTNSGGARASNDNAIDDEFSNPSNFIYENQIGGDGSSSSTLLTWTFSTPIIGFGLDALGVADIGLQVSIDDGSGIQTFVLFDIIAPAMGTDADGFVGFIGMGPITSITFTSSNPDFSDGFDFDNLIFALAPDINGEIPLPAAAPLFIAGLGGLFAASRRKKKRA